MRRPRDGLSVKALGGRRKSIETIPQRQPEERIKPMPPSSGATSGSQHADFSIYKILQSRASSLASKLSSLFGTRKVTDRKGEHSVKLAVNISKADGTDNSNMKSVKPIITVYNCRTPKPVGAKEPNLAEMQNAESNQTEAIIFGERSISIEECQQLIAQIRSKFYDELIEWSKINEIFKYFSSMSSLNSKGIAGFLDHYLIDIQCIKLLLENRFKVKVGSDTYVDSIKLAFDGISIIKDSLLEQAIFMASVGNIMKKIELRRQEFEKAVLALDFFENSGIASSTSLNPKHSKKIGILLLHAQEASDSYADATQQDDYALVLNTFKDLEGVPKIIDAAIEVFKRAEDQVRKYQKDGLI